MTARSDAEVEAYRQRRLIHVYGDGVPKPVTTFEEASFPEYVQNEVLKVRVCSWGSGRGASEYVQSKVLKVRERGEGGSGGGVRSEVCSWGAGGGRKVEGGEGWW